MLGMGVAIIAGVLWMVLAHWEWWPSLSCGCCQCWLWWPSLMRVEVGELVMNIDAEWDKEE